MRKSTKILLAGAAVAAAVAVPVAAVASNDSETPITGEALEKATAAALAVTGEGRVTDTEVGDEESYYEVEVTLDDGTEIDVQLDENFNYVGSEIDDPNEPEDNDGD